MIQFAHHIAATWDVSETLAVEICKCFEKRYSPFVVADYVPCVAAEIENTQVFEMYDFLENIAALGPRKTRLLNAMKKAGALTEDISERIQLTTNAFELDDMLAAYRSNPRSRGQLALAKGLGELADRFERQEEEEKTPEELAEPYVGSHPSLKKVDQVLEAVRDILIERLSVDETVRAMAREFTIDEGFFEVIPKKRKDRQWVAYVNKQLKMDELSDDELAKLFIAEHKKQIRCKVNVQLFHITELLRQHFIVNPDFTGFDIICGLIDECWSRLLQPMVEKEVKNIMQDRLDRSIGSGIIRDLEKEGDREQRQGPFLALLGPSSRSLIMVAADASGRLLGATALQLSQNDKPDRYQRLVQIARRYRIATILIPENETADHLREVVSKAFSGEPLMVEVVACPLNEVTRRLAASEWFEKNFSDLDSDMRAAFAMVLRFAPPLRLIPSIGVGYFSLHPMQEAVSEACLLKSITRRFAIGTLKEGVVLNQLEDSILPTLMDLPEKLVAEIKRQIAKGTLVTKQDLNNVPGISDAQYTNISGYLIMPNSPNALDKTLVHPMHFEWVELNCESLSYSPEALINDPDVLRTIENDDVAEKLFVEKKLRTQLQAGQKHLSGGSPQKRRRHRLMELSEDTIVTGKVTNVTPFGVFVDINAVCDGLVHISQLADSYVENAEQVVSVHDTVNVRIVKVDPKKRRISLSMKNLGNLAPRISPTQTQLSSLADHFKNR